MSINIKREIKYTTVGTNNSLTQVFRNNYLADSIPTHIPFFSFYKTGFYTYGGTFNYYGQDTYSIFTNLVRPPIRFILTSHTESLSGDSYFLHNVYRLDYDTYKLFNDNQITNSPNLSSTNNSVDNRTSITNGTNTNPDSQSRQISNSSNIPYGNNTIPIPEKFFGDFVTNNDLNTIQNYFNTPLFSITASTSAITGNIYDLFIDQYVKKLGNYKTELFLDKSQYFIDTKIIVNVDLNKNYEDFIQNNNNVASQYIWNDNLQISSTNSYLHTIDKGPFIGLNVLGSFFVYFIVPDKPKLEYPIMTGSLTTFTPEFRWSNGDKADSFLLQINYNTGDTNFTGTVFNYPIEKSTKNLQISTDVIKSSDTETSTNKSIYTFQVPIKSNSSFIYRIGNSKELIDIFNVKRNVVTFSDFYTAFSQIDPIIGYVGIESDSPYVEDITGLLIAPSLDYENLSSGNFSLNGIVSGSDYTIITGATIQLQYPNINFYITTTTDSNGIYSFSGLQTGIYTTTAIYRGYEHNTKLINITGDTVTDFIINILWGDNYDTYGQLNSYFFE